MLIPNKHGESGIFKEIWSEFNKLREYVQSIKPIGGKNIHTKQTTLGTIIQGSAESVAGEGINYYDSLDISSSYSENDIVHNTGSTVKYYSGSVEYYCYPCVAICLQDVPTMTGSLSGSTYVPNRTPGIFYMPIFEDPDSGPATLTGSLKYWDIISLGPQVVSTCMDADTEIRTALNGVALEPENCVSKSINYWN